MHYICTLSTKVLVSLISDPFSITTVAWSVSHILLLWSSSSPLIAIVPIHSFIVVLDITQKITKIHIILHARHNKNVSHTKVKPKESCDLELFHFGGHKRPGSLLH